MQNHYRDETRRIAVDEKEYIAADADGPHACASFCNNALPWVQACVSAFTASGAHTARTASNGSALGTLKANFINTLPNMNT